MGFSSVWRKLQSVGTEEDAGLWWGVGEISRFQRWGEGLKAWGREECSTEERGFRGEGSGSEDQDGATGSCEELESWEFPRGLQGSREVNGVQGMDAELKIGHKGLGKEFRNKGRASTLRRKKHEVRDGTRVWGGMQDWERAWGPGEQHRIHRKNVGLGKRRRFQG